MSSTPTGSSEAETIEQKFKVCPRCRQNAPVEQLTCKRDNTLLVRGRVYRSPWLNVVIQERFQIEKEVGSGQMTTVFSGKDLKTELPVAIKLLHPHLVADRKTNSRFEDASMSALSLSHPNIVKTIAVGETTEYMRLPFLITEFLQGQTLAEYFKANPGPLALPERHLTRIMMSACDALEYAESLGHLHRDLKASNLFLTETLGAIDFDVSKAELKIVDFGLAERLFRFLEWTDLQVQTHTTSVYGNPAYMCPEFAMTSKVSVQSDMYSLGCIMYEAVTGFAPFVGMNNFDTIFKHLKETPKKFSSKSPVSKDLELIILRCMKKLGCERYESYKELKADLRRAAG